MDSNKEILLKKAFDDYINLMLYDFPIDRIREVVDNDVFGYGTTVDEKVLEIKRLRKIVTDQREQGAGLEMKINMMPIHRRISPNEDTALFMDEFEISMVIDGTKNMIPLRLTSVFEYRDKTWKLVHLHGSKAVETEDDTWHLDEWKQKNEELQRLVDEKTADLANKNRELEIEASLERVRAVAMSMQKPDDILDVCQIISDQLELLNVTDIRNTQVAIIDEKKKNYLNYQYFSPYSKKVFEVTEYENNPESQAMVSEMQKSANSFYNGVIMGKALQEFRDWRKKYNQYPDPLMDKSSTVYYYFYSIGNGGLGLTTYKKISQSSLQIFKRFHKVFKLAYQRFIDIEKAEAQAREAKIETALERVRAVAMAMHKPEDLSAIGKTIFFDLKSLGFDSIRNTEIIINSHEKETVTSHHYSDYGKEEIIDIGYRENPIVKKWAEDLKKADDAFVPVSIPEKELKSWNQYRLEIGYKSDPKMVSAEGVHYYSYSTGLGALSISTWQILSDDQIKILERFRNVFKLSYQRYLDIAQAEAQAREAQIELALERVRARTMAMQKSEELKEVIQLVYEQFVHLKINVDHAGFVVDYTPKGDWHFWIADRQEIPSKITHPYFDSIWAHQFNEAKVKGIDFFTTHLNFEEKNKFYKEMFKYIPGLPKASKEFYFKSAGLAGSTVVLDNVGLYFENFSGIPYSDEENNTLMRFGKVFQQTYTRFNDLKQAEAQAREAQIETALERVRSKTMAMHNSHDMAITVTTLFEEVLKLGLDDDIRCGIGILEGTERMETRSATLDQKGEVDLKIGMLDMTIHPLLKRIKNGWVRREIHYVDQMAGKDVVKYYTALNNEPDYPFQRDLNTLPKIEYHNSFSFPEGIIFAFSPNPMSEEAAKVFERFARVFGQTYRRYLDLQKAEEQAREAQIEAALERIRAQAMAMQHSDDLKKSAIIVFDEFEKLNLSVQRCGIGIINQENYDCELWSTVVNADGKKEIATGTLSLMGHPLLKGTLDAWKKQEPHFYILEGEELVQYYKLIKKSGFHLPDKIIEKAASMPKQYFYNSLFGAGGLYVFSNSVPSEKEKQIVRRFAEVFNLTYTRYEDLQKAEARTKEAIKQASLDRVRGEIASMRSAGDLDRITPLIWHELNALEVPFIRCGVLIMDDDTEMVQTHLSAPDGTAMGIFELPYDSEQVAKGAVKHWKIKTIYKEFWDKKKFLDFMKTLLEQGKIKDTETYTGAVEPPESLYLNFIPFKQGMLYVGNSEPLADEKIALVESLANAFSYAYARYEDFNVLEEAKERVEKTLSDLKATQSQLIHAEKMASLGELTAGIAHEIQNPLNFVNNFSEVSTDLIEELNEEIKKGDTLEVKAIAKDLLQNLEKINHHGKRASNIVKSMLEHSRAGSGEKQLTDLNALADEYLRLAYHGLRAKDKSFNADFRLEADEDLPKVKVLGQDIGRVLLNLINNAFYAVSDKTKQNENEYKPTVIVSTKNLDDKIEIRVKDNGNGIPDSVKDKIFQPFFTTKPTGQGTGLGLSMSYDIITKGHGGELKVETKEARHDDPVGRGEGSEFIIQLPL